MFFHNSCPENSWNQLKKKIVFSSLFTALYSLWKRELIENIKEFSSILATDSSSFRARVCLKKKEKVKDWIIGIG